MTDADTPAPRTEQPPTAPAHTDPNDAAARLRTAIRDAFAGAGARPAEIGPRDLVIVLDDRDFARSCLAAASANEARFAAQLVDIRVLLHGDKVLDEIAPGLRDRLLRAARGAT